MLEIPHKTCKKCGKTKEWFYFKGHNTCEDCYVPRVSELEKLRQNESLKSSFEQTFMKVKKNRAP